MPQRDKERIGGALIGMIGMVVSYLFWHWSASKADWYVFFIITATGPVFAVTGLALLFVPSYRLERLDRGEDISNLQGAALVTPRWWVIAGIALLVELAYLFSLGIVGRE